MSTLQSAASHNNSSSSILVWIKARPILAMVILMYLLAWPKLIGSATDSYGLTQLHLSPWLDILTGWAPAIAAFTITLLAQGKAGASELLRKIVRWRVGVSWYLVVVLGSAAAILAEGGLYELLTGNGEALPITQMPLSQAALSFVSILVLYMLVNTEEIAWRGFALPRLQNRHGALKASVILWVPWTLFHLPYFFTKDSVLQQMGFVTFASGTFALTIIFTWLFNNTKGSVFICTFLHAMLNTWPLLLMPAQSSMPVYLQYVMDGVIVLLLVLNFGAERLSRKPDSEPFVY
jgi:membrane protease YdiL (CAAX protease family)